MPSRDEMIAALRHEVVPELRRRGFAGVLPHLRRISDGRVDLLTIQFDRHGGGFVVEVAGWRGEEFGAADGRTIPATRLTAHDLHPTQRLRLGSGRPANDHWFRFDRAETVGAVARQVLARLDQAEAWWAVPHTRTS